jgi:hypothetical protein
MHRHTLILHPCVASLVSCNVFINKLKIVVWLMLPINQQQLATRSIFSENKQATSISIMLINGHGTMDIISKSTKDHMFELLLYVC